MATATINTASSNFLELVIFEFGTVSIDRVLDALVLSSASALLYVRPGVVCVGDVLMENRISFV